MMDWKNLGFQYHKTHALVRSSFRNGKWGALEVLHDFNFSLHAAAIALQYGQSCFEGLKAFQTKTKETVLFRPYKNAVRMQNSAARLCMEAPSEDLFVEACIRVVQENKDFLPPYGTGASLYLRPTLIGVDPAIGIAPSKNFDFYVLVTPVGPYYKDGFFPVNALIVEDYDRAAPLGTGQAKVAGNYAAALLPGILTKEKGYPIALFTDPIEHKYIDEFGTSNFFGIKGKEYHTPKSSSILPSITNESLQDLMSHRGYNIVKRPIPVSELDQFSEVGACGTAAIITPIYSITRIPDNTLSALEQKPTIITYGEPKKAGEVLTSLYQELQGIQYGEIPDRHDWLVKVPASSQAPKADL